MFSLSGKMPVFVRCLIIVDAIFCINNFDNMLSHPVLRLVGRLYNILGSLQSIHQHHLLAIENWYSVYSFNISEHFTIVLILQVICMAIGQHHFITYDCISDIHECALGMAGCAKSYMATCKETYGSSICKCKDNYLGDGKHCHSKWS